MKEISKEELKSIFDSAVKKIYQKKGHYLFRPAVNGETVLTVVAGKLETFKRSGPGDIILRNIEIGSSAETYMVPEDKFYRRYVLLGANGEEVSWEAVKTKGTDLGINNPMVYGIYMLGTSHIIDGQKWYEASAQGRIEAFMFCQGEQPIQFMAPWNEMMLCELGDFIARPVPGAADDIYRIEQDTFHLTYKEIA